MSRPQSVKGNLVREAWDFESLRDEEVSACWEWEFYRELYTLNHLFRTQVEDARRGKRKKSSGFLWDPFNPPLRTINYPIVGLASYSREIWPALHFQEAHPDVRTRGSEANRRWLELEIYSRSTEVESLALNPPLEALWSARSVKEFTHVISTSQGLVALPFCDADESLVVLRVPWRKTDKELCFIFEKFFAKWIQMERGDRSPTQPEEKRGKKPISKLRKELKSLGAKRLIGQFGTQVKARDYAIAQNRPGAIYADPKDWSLAKNTVRKILDELGP